MDDAAAATGRRTSWMVIAAVAAAVCLPGCSRDGSRETLPAGIQPPAAHSAASDAANTSALSGPQHLYVVYCNGTVDHLDIVRQAKVDSFALSPRSGTPPAIANLRLPGVRPDSCLARPFVSDSVDARPEGVAYIVASDHVDRSNTDGRKPYSLLTFALPGWTLQARQDLGSFDVLNGTPPRIARRADGRMEVAQDNMGAASAMLQEARQFAGSDSLRTAQPLAWSGGTVLVEYAASDTGTATAAYALVNPALRSVVRINGVPGGDPEPSLTLAPGGRYVLHAVRRLAPFDGGQKLVATGELRLYGADGKLVQTLTDQRVAGAWHAVTIAPQGLTVFTDRRGNYHFVPLGTAFDPRPVHDRLTDDLDGSRPGIVYARP